MNAHFNKNIFIKYMIITLCVMIFNGCKSIQYVDREVPVEVTKIEYKNLLLHDSIYIHDSVSVYINGDTVYKDRIKLIYKDRLKNDTIIIRDSIEKPLYITKEVVEKSRNKPTNLLSIILISSGIVLWILPIIYSVTYIIQKLRRR